VSADGDGGDRRSRGGGGTGGASTGEALRVDVNVSRVLGGVLKERGWDGAGIAMFLVLMLLNLSIGCNQAIPCHRIKEGIV